MNVFGTVKTSINTREAVEHYGIEVNRYGKALCPFHNDRHPSMVVYDDHYHCFACGEHGDVIDLVAYLYGLPVLDAANKLIAKLKAEIDSLKQEISDYKSVHSKLRAAELERENTELRGKVRSYEDVIQRNNLWRFFHPHREKAVTRDEAR